MKPYIKKIPIVLTAAALVGQLSLPAAAIVAVQPRAFQGDDASVLAAEWE
ncbi:hypothetical protein [Pseudoflavonifractor sp.]